MNALEFLNNKGIKTPTVNTTRLPDNEFGLHSVTDLMDEYLEYKLNNLSQHLVSKRDFIKDDYVWFCGEINQVEAVKGDEACIVELKGKLHQVVNKNELTNVC